MIKLFDDGAIGAGGRECADVHLKNDCLIPRSSMPLACSPMIAVVVDHLARTEYAVWLIVRRGIWNLHLAIDPELVMRTGRCCRYCGDETSVVQPLHLVRGIQHHLDALHGGRPQPESYATAFECGTESRVDHEFSASGSAGSVRKKPD